MKQIQKLEQLRHSLYAYVGAIHIHTTYSDGTGTVDEVINAAQKSKSWEKIFRSGDVSRSECICSGLEFNTEW